MLKIFAVVLLQAIAVYTLKPPVSRAVLRERMKYFDRAPRILTGRNAHLGEHPYVVNILHEEVHLCIGSYIRQSWVLTTAQCLRWESKDMNLTLIMGSVDLDGSGGQTRHSKVYYVHSMYNKDTSLHNIGLVQLSEAFLLSKHIEIIRLSMIPLKSQSNSSCFVSGWGSTVRDTGLEYYPKLQVSTLTLLSDDECDVLFGFFDMVPDIDKPTTRFAAGNMICGTENGCHGESGAPVICNRTLVGIISWNSGCDLQSPAVMEPIHYNIPWMENITGSLFMLRSRASNFDDVLYGLFISLGVILCSKT
ncbi:hypothetical protein Trydic_g3653 [Trypoxylus dichotomus]